MALQLAGHAGHLIKKMRRAPLLEISKGGTDFSTAADTAAEELIIGGIRTRFPEDAILAEESTKASWIASEYQGKKNAWVIDPVDGTTVYNRGLENYAVSIGHMSLGEPQFGVVSLPAISFDDGNLFFGTHWLPAAQCDPVRGTFVEISVSLPRPYHQCVFGTSFGYSPENKSRTLMYLARLNCMNFRTCLARGSVVEGLIRVAMGELDAYFEPAIKPWDIAAAGLIVHRAGGIVTRMDGSPWSPFYPDILAASNPALHQAMVELLNNK
jgi:myo-inositol-1(or 4)-monophosphatase